MNSIFLACTLASLYASISVFRAGDTGGGFVLIFFVLFFGVFLVAGILPRLAEKSERAAKLRRFVCGEQKYRSPFVPHWHMMILIIAAVLLVAAVVIIPIAVKFLK
jgi:NADH:ubiquinone oxidoreductase subunit 3 (subunit A)